VYMAMEVMAVSELAWLLLNDPLPKP
jgi:hypothetical protein